MSHRPPAQRHRPSGQSPASRNLAEWFRRLGDLLRSARVHGVAHEQVARGRDLLVEELVALIGYHAPLVFRCSPLEIWLRDEMLVEPPAADGDEPAERRVPFLLHRDGVRGFTFDSRATHEDARVLVQALVLAAAAPTSDEDIVTRLWECDLSGLSVELAALDQVVPAQGPEAKARPPVETPLPAPPWARVTDPADVNATWGAQDAMREFAPRAWSELWRLENESCPSERASELVEAVLGTSADPAARAAVAAGIATWLAGAAQRCDWTEAAQALDVLHRADAGAEHSPEALRRALATLDVEVIADRLDESDRDTLARFLALAVRIGPSAIDLIVGVLARAGRARVRAAATTALGYAAAAAPALLAQHLRHPRWYVVRNVVTALGQIGGEDIAPPLGIALRHADQRVRRAAVAALGQVPMHRRTPLLVSQLDLGDAATQDAVLAQLAQEPDPRAVDELLRRVEAPSFADRTEAARVALVETLGAIAGESAIEVLGNRLRQGGWLAKKGPERTAAARALATIGTPGALELLREGARSHVEAVREACAAVLAPSREAA